jgi:hypothetical protein
MTMTRLDGEPAQAGTPSPEWDERRRLAKAILAASRAMPDPAAHLLRLLGRPVASLKARLADVQTSAHRSRHDGRGRLWLEQAVARATSEVRA